MRVVGLTGSIGTGKTTTAKLFASRGVPVHDADAAVHRLYRSSAAGLIEAAFPGVTAGGVVDRRLLGERVIGDPPALQRLEAIVHPLVRASEEEFLAQARAASRWLALVDVPLLFETGAARRFDVILVVTAAPEVQRARVLARPDMTEAKLRALLDRQVPDSEKRRGAHFVIDTGRVPEAAEREVDAILRALASG